MYRYPMNVSLARNSRHMSHNEREKAVKIQSRVPNKRYRTGRFKNAKQRRSTVVPSKVEGTSAYMCTGKM